MMITQGATYRAAVNKAKQTQKQRQQTQPAALPVAMMPKAQELGAAGNIPGTPQRQPDANVQGTALPTDPVYQSDINNATTTYNDTQTGLTDSIQNSAFNYGDPTAMAAYGVTETANPNSALAVAARNALRTSNVDENRRLGNGTALSSLATNDAGIIGTNQQNADAAAKARFNAAVQNYQLRSTAAKDAETGQINSDMANEAKEAVNNLPTTSPTPPVGTPSPTPTSNTPPSANPLAANANNGNRANEQLKQKGTPMGGFR